MITAHSFSRHIGRAGLVGIALLVAAIVFAAAFVVRAYLGPVSLGPLAAPLRTAIGEILPGLAVRYDDVALEWSADEDRLNLVIVGARVFDQHGRIIAQAPEAEIGLALGQMLQGRVKVRSITLVGVQLTLLRSADGVLRLGVQGGQQQSDILQRIRDIVARGGQGGGSLDTVAVRKARLAFYDLPTGLFVVAPDSSLQMSRDPDRSGALKAVVDARIEISGKSAHVRAAIRLPASGGAVRGDVSITGLSLHSLSENARTFARLAPFDLTMDLSGDFLLDNGGRLHSLEFGLGAAGTVEGLGPPLHVRTLRASGRYDAVTGRLLIDDASLAGIQASAHLQGQGDLSFSTSGALTRAAMALDFDQIAINMPGVMKRTVLLPRASVRGSYLPDAGTIEIDQALLSGGQLSAKFAGRVILAGSRSPEIDIDGNIASIAVRDLLRYWPLQAGPGARNWIDANVSAGTLGPVMIHTQLPVGALTADALPESALLVTFPVTGATISYIHGMTPLTRVAGAGILTGDTFRATVSSGGAGPLSIAEGHVTIPDLHVGGTKADIAARVVGNVSDVLALLDEKPLQYPSRFHVRRHTASGRADIALDVRVPTERYVNVDSTQISAKAAIGGLGLSINDHIAIVDGDLAFAIDNNALRAAGKVLVSGTPLNVDWREVFKPAGPESTKIAVSGTLSDAAREALGIHTADFLTGPVGVDGELDGYRGDIRRAQLRLDLTGSAISVGTIGFSKDPGVPAQAQLSAEFQTGGITRISDLSLSGAAIASHAFLRLGPDGQLQTLSMPSFRAGPNDDFALNVTADPVQGITASIAGHSFDAQSFIAHLTQTGPAHPGEKAEHVPTPYHVSARLDRLTMREGVMLSAVSFDATGTGRKLKSLALNAAITKSATLVAHIAGGEGARRLTLETGDAGALLRAFFGTSTVKGGSFAIDALVPAGTAAVPAGAWDFSGKIALTNFTVTNQPFLTQLFSSGSFGGLSDLMRGKGILIDTLEIPFDLRGDVLTIHEARAAGPSLGLTADGYYDMHSDQIGLQGVFAPLYGINGIWGAIPILGNVLVSKKGEGVLGVTYNASGSAGDPQVAVNPLSMLTPGILRRIFEGAAPSAPPAQANTVPAPPNDPAQ